jgi:tetratricopeptide (TPR) repeat protein
VNVATLIGQAEEALEDGDLETALTLGKQLIEARHTFGFEAVARAHHANGDDDEAFAILERGVKEAPHVWTLWHLLGNYASDADDFERAFTSYERALACDRVEADVVHLNYATDLNRAGRSDEALGRLMLVRDPELLTAAAVVRVEALNALGRHDETLASAKQALGAADAHADSNDIARIYCAVADALRARGDRDAALAASWKAVAYDSSSERAMTLVREIEGLYSGKARYFRLLVHGVWPNLDQGDGDGPADHGFWMKCDVVADTQEEALRFISRFEPAETRGSLRIDETESVRGAQADQPKGLYWCSGKAFYLEEKG